MIHFKNYRKPDTLEEAYALNQKRSAVLAGGFCFLRLGNRTVQDLIDLSGLLSCDIEESEEEFRIGAMVTLRALELHPGLEQYSDGAIKQCVRHIVGTQFRNCATVGGSLYGRFGFSDVLTCFMAMDSYVELYKGGRIPLRDFAKMDKDNDILTAVTVKKTEMRMAYESMRNEAVDFPVLSVAVAEYAKKAECGDTPAKTVISVGARPAKAACAVTEGKLSELEQTARKQAVQNLTDGFTYGSNLRGSGEYRRYLAQILTDRALARIHEVRSQAEERQTEEEGSR